MHAADVRTDEALMNAYATGDARAFECLYDRHERHAHRFILRCLGPAFADAADDVLQDTWITVAKSAAAYKPTARFTTWLFTIARSRVIDHLRRQRPGTVSLETTDAQGEELSLADFIAADERDEPVARIESRQQAQAFLQALDALPGDQREAFLLQAEADMSLEEIAQATGVGIETAKSRLRYARAKLRALLAPWSTAP